MNRRPPGHLQFQVNRRRSSQVTKVGSVPSGIQWSTRLGCIIQQPKCVQSADQRLWDLVRGASYTSMCASRHAALNITSIPARRCWDKVLLDSLGGPTNPPFDWTVQRRGLSAALVGQSAAPWPENAWPTCTHAHQFSSVIIGSQAYKFTTHVDIVQVTRCWCLELRAKASVFGGQWISATRSKQNTTLHTLGYGNLTGRIAWKMCLFRCRSSYVRPLFPCKNYDVIFSPKLYVWDAAKIFFFLLLLTRKRQGHFMQICEYRGLIQ